VAGEAARHGREWLESPENPLTLSASEG